MNFIISKRRLVREDFRRKILKGVPLQNEFLLKHLFSNNKPAMLIVLKTDPKDARKQATEGLKDR